MNKSTREEEDEQFIAAHMVVSDPVVVKLMTALCSSKCCFFSYVYIRRLKLICNIYCTDFSHAHMFSSHLFEFHLSYKEILLH
jgi:hypothetical protein